MDIIRSYLEINIICCDDYNYCMISIHSPNLRTEHVNKIEHLGM